MDSSTSTSRSKTCPLCLADHRACQDRWFGAHDQEHSLRSAEVSETQGREDAQCKGRARGGGECGCGTRGREGARADVRRGREVLRVDPERDVYQLGLLGSRWIQIDAFVLELEGRGWTHMDPKGFR